MMLHLSHTLRWQSLGTGALHVTTGQAWVTRDGIAEDWVLSAGESLPLRAGELITLGPLHEGHPVALSVPGPQPGLLAVLRTALLARAAGLARGLARVLNEGLLALARKAEATACRAQGSICAGESMASAGGLK